MSIKDEISKIDSGLNEIYNKLGKLDAIANLIDIRSDNLDWMKSERSQYAIYHMCEMVGQVFKEFSDTQAEIEVALGSLKQ